MMPTAGTHVLLTLGEPILVVLGEMPTTIGAIEGEILDILAGGAGHDTVVVQAMRLLREAWANDSKVHPFVTMRAVISVPYRNIRGLVTVPARAK